jgi:ketosteroid isomerase-like protein
MTNADRQQLIERFIAAYNGFDIDGMVALVHPEIVFKNVSGGVATAEAGGIEAFRDMAMQSKAAFTSRKQTPTDIRFDAETAVVDITYEGVLAVDFPNGMKAGDVLRLNGRSEYTFRDGRIYQIIDFS